MLYKAFISYSHTADGRLAPALRTALRRIGQPWYRRFSVDSGDELSRVSFSPDGKLLAASSEAAGGNPSKVFLWDVGTRKLLGPTIEARSFAFSPDGKVLATEGDDGKSIVLRDVLTHRP